MFKNSEKEAFENSLIHWLKLSKEFTNSKITELYELGHYLVDNLLSKVAIFIAIKEGRSKELKDPKNPKFTKNHKDLYVDFLQNNSKYDIVKYEPVMQDHHKNRNFYQHNPESIKFGIRQDFAIQYVKEVERIMKELKIIKSPADTLPTSYLSFTGISMDGMNLSYDQQKWQKFYNRMANKDTKYLGIDIQNLLNSKIYESDFENVLKMNIGAKRRYIIIYNNKEWQFSFINLRGATEKYEIFVRNETTGQKYDYFQPDINQNVLNEWLDYILESCTKAGLKIDY